jgi:serine/threonine protein kinase
VIVDFGLAKRLDSDSTAWTQDGAVLGTASYMAPEQAAGQAAAAGPAVDVYALGAVLYEMLTGRPPFRGATWGQTVEQVLRDDPTPPTRSHPDVPADLEAVCLKCLEKEPARRYESARALADDLGRFLADTRVTAEPPAERDRLARLAARDGYEIVGEVGRGPRSVVYRAVSGPLRQPVALKVFSAGCCPQDAWDERLRRGAAAWSLLAHPQVVVPAGAGWWDGRPYVAVEYAPHGSLAARLTGRPQPVREALRLVAQLAEVVCYLHRQGVVHGNLKPGNVLFAADGIPRVTDLRPAGGLCHGPAPEGDADPTGLGYLPPELADDPTAAPRPHADVYGLGVILYELLTGRPAVEGATARDVRDRLRSHDPGPPSSLNAEVKPELDWLCLRCLPRNPWARFPRAYDVLTRLRGIQAASPGHDGRGPPRK